MFVENYFGIVLKIVYCLIGSLCELIVWCYVKFDFSVIVIIIKECFGSVILCVNNKQVVEQYSESEKCVFYCV